MNIIVCIKQVPETTDVKINPETNTLVREGVESIINPFDLYAIEEGVRLKEKNGGKVTVITMGPPQAEKALRDAVSVGADEVILISDRNFAGSDTLATSYTLARAIKKIQEFDLVICGKQAIDGDTAQVGPEIAEELDIPCVTYVSKISEVGENFIIVERMMEEGKQIIKSPLPMVMTVVKEINEPRLPSLKGKMKARKQEIVIWNAATLACEIDRIGLQGSPTAVVKIFAPPQRSGGEILTGDIESQAKKLVEKLKEDKIV